MLNFFKGWANLSSLDNTSHLIVITSKTKLPSKNYKMYPKDVKNGLTFADISFLPGQQKRKLIVFLHYLLMFEINLEQLTLEIE